MANRLILRIFLFLLIPFLLWGTQKEKKAYELIYQDVQILKQHVLKLDNKMGLQQDGLPTVRRQVGAVGSQVGAEAS